MTGDWGRGEWGPVSVRKEEKVLEMDGGDVLKATELYILKGLKWYLLGDIQFTTIEKANKI